MKLGWGSRRVGNEFYCCCCLCFCTWLICILGQRQLGQGQRREGHKFTFRVSAVSGEGGKSNRERKGERVKVTAQANLKKELNQLGMKLRQLK